MTCFCLQSKQKKTHHNPDRKIEIHMYFLSKFNSVTSKTWDKNTFASKIHYMLLLLNAPFHVRSLANNRGVSTKWILRCASTILQKRPGVDQM